MHLHLLAKINFMFKKRTKTSFDLKQTKIISLKNSQGNKQAVGKSTIMVMLQLHKRQETRVCSMHNGYATIAQVTTCLLLPLLILSLDTTIPF